MYCKYCGKPTENPSAVCDECLNKSVNPEQVYAPVPPIVTPAPTVSKSYRLGPAIVSTVLGTIGYIVSIVPMYYIEIFATIGLDYSTIIALAFLSLAMGIVSLVMGIVAINGFKAAKRQGVKPVVTLVFGIVGVVSAAITLFIWVVFFFGLVLALPLYRYY